MFYMSDETRIDYVKARIALLKKGHADDRARLARAEELVRHREERIDRAGAGPEPMEIVLYAEDNNIDIETEAGLRKVVADLDKKSGRRQPRDRKRQEGAATLPDAAEMLRYAEVNKIDMSSEAGVRQVVAALAGGN